MQSNNSNSVHAYVTPAIQQYVCQKSHSVLDNYVLFCLFFLFFVFFIIHISFNYLYFELLVGFNLSH